MATVNVDTIAAYSDGLATKVNWLGPKVNGCFVLFYVHLMNYENVKMAVS